ncbi:uncharacterized protein IWZ02DRAFT_273888 [Phyllosticta citriasiana]|uniref:Uncharacterized protein n=1 Tax=Phyllosticta citriasiana TaxID=595635 RepID=A0ABR1KZ75_9PEZI
MKFHHANIACQGSKPVGWCSPISMSTFNFGLLLFSLTMTLLPMTVRLTTAICIKDFDSPARSHQDKHHNSLHINYQNYHNYHNTSTSTTSITSTTAATTSPTTTTTTNDTSNKNVVRMLQPSLLPMPLPLLLRLFKHIDRGHQPRRHRRGKPSLATNHPRHGLVRPQLRN